MQLHTLAERLSVPLLPTATVWQASEDPLTDDDPQASQAFHDMQAALGGGLDIGATQGLSQADVMARNVVDHAPQSRVGTPLQHMFFAVVGHPGRARRLRSRPTRGHQKS